MILQKKSRKRMRPFVSSMFPAWAAHLLCVTSYEARYFSQILVTGESGAVLVCRFGRHLEQFCVLT